MSPVSLRAGPATGRGERAGVLRAQLHSGERGCRMSKEARRLSVAATLTVILFIAFFDTFTQIPLISPYAASLGAGAVMTGWIVGIYSLTNSFGNIAAGFVLDKGGRRLPLAIGLAWTGFAAFLYGPARTPVQLLPAGTTRRGLRYRMRAGLGALWGVPSRLGPMGSCILRQVWRPRGVFVTVFIGMAAGSLLALPLPETLKHHDQTSRREVSPASVP